MITKLVGLALMALVTSSAGNAVEKNIVETVEGADLKITAHNGTVMVDNAKVVKADIPTSNGIIHIIDAVMLPPPSN
jgi:uncharacterized surface protein with fasciclin (FAS1) repeats